MVAGLQKGKKEPATPSGMAGSLLLCAADQESCLWTGSPPPFGRHGNPPIGVNVLSGTLRDWTSSFHVPDDVSLWN